MSDQTNVIPKAENATSAKMELDHWQLRVENDVAESVKKNFVPEPKVGVALPSEIINEIGLHVHDAVDFGNLRLVNRTFYRALDTAFAKNFGNNRVIFPRYGSFHDFFAFLASVSVASHYIDKIVLISQGMKEHEYGYDWAWEALVNWNMVDVDNTDMSIMHAANVNHAEKLTYVIEPFLETGGYRSLLSLLLVYLPNLRKIEIRKMKPGEHSPGWKGPEILKQLSFYSPALDTTTVYYGDWKYDTKHLRVTHHKDEFGDDVIELDAGPQASSEDDIKAAVAITKHQARLDFLPST